LTSRGTGIIGQVRFFPDSSGFQIENMRVIVLCCGDMRSEDENTMFKSILTDEPVRSFPVSDGAETASATAGPDPFLREEGDAA